MRANIPFPMPCQSGKVIACASFSGADVFPPCPVTFLFSSASFVRNLCIFCRKALHVLPKSPASFSEALFGMRFHLQSVLCGFLCRYLPAVLREIFSPEADAFKIVCFLDSLWLIVGKSVCAGTRKNEAFKKNFVYSFARACKKYVSLAA